MNLFIFGFYFIFTMVNLYELKNNLHNKDAI